MPKESTNERALEQELRDTIAMLQAKATEMGDWQKADADTRESFTKMNERIDQLQDGLKELAKSKRSPVGDTSDPTDDAANGEAKAALVAYLRKGEQRLTPAQRDALERHEKALSVDSDPDGGYVVTPDTSGRISTIIYETSPVRSVASVQSITTDALEGLFDGDEAAAEWVSERGSRTATDTPQLGQYRIPVHELYANPRATQKLLDDAAVDIEAWLATKVADRFARTENLAFVLGSGVGQPRGFMTYPNGTNRGQVEQLPTGSTSGFTAESVIDVVYALKNGYRAGAVWAMNRATVGQVRTIRDDSGATTGTGQFMWTPGFGGEPSLLAGYPIVEMEDIADAEDGALFAAFGNFRAAYQIVDRQGVRVLRDPFSAKPFVEFYTTKRTGGDVINFEAFKIARSAAS